MADCNCDNLFVTGRTDLGGRLDVSGNLAVGRDPSLGLHADLSVTGSTTLYGALTVGGMTTLNGGLSVTGNLTLSGTVDGRNVAQDGRTLDQHLRDKNNPHGVTAAQVGALSLSGGTISGTLTLQGALCVGGLAVNEFSGDPTLATNSDLVLPTQKAVKGYVDGVASSLQQHFNQALTTKAALAGALGQDFQAKNLTVAGNISFGTQVRQMLNLWGTQHGVGVQSSTTYFRTHKNFAWYAGGTHHDGELNPGGGTAQMVIKDGKVGIGPADLSLGNLVIASDNTSAVKRGQLVIQGVANPALRLYFGIYTDANPPYAALDFVEELKAWRNISLAHHGGNVGIGTAGPADKLDVAGYVRILSNSNPIRFTSQWSGFPDAVTNQAEISNDTNAYKTLMIIGNKSAGMGRRVSVWDRLEVNGVLLVTRDIQAEGQVWSVHGYRTAHMDLAENYASDQDLQPGEVVCLDPQSDAIARSQTANDSTLVGVVSTQPGYLLNADPDLSAATKFPVALCGRVPCKVTAENGPIRRGDLLTSSSTPGHAMKARPISIDGESVYRPGTIIGKALEPLGTGAGIIEVFIALN